MFGKKFYILNPIEIGNRIIYPIVLLKFMQINNIFYNISYEVSAFKIIENNNTFFKNLSLNKKDFQHIKDI